MSRAKKLAPPKDWMPTRYIGRTAELKVDDATLSTLYQAGFLDCNVQQAAAMLGASPADLSMFLKHCPQAAEAFEDGRAYGQVRVLKNQMKHSETNPDSAFKLGKIRLGQKDEMTVAIKQDVREFSDSELKNILAEHAKMIELTPNPPKMDDLAKNAAVDAEFAEISTE